MTSPIHATVRDHLATALLRLADYNAEDKVAPACILWPDKQRQWESLVPALAVAGRHVLTLGPWQPTAMTGPAIWIKAVLGRRLEGAGWDQAEVPIVYLPGIGRADLRLAEDCPTHLLPLVELLFRGAVFGHPNGKDWTVVAFLRATSPGPELDVATDPKTLDAAVRALEAFAHLPVADLRAGRLEAADFDKFLVNDVDGTVLRWLNEPDATKATMGPSAWQAFTEVCKSELGVGVESDGPLVAADRLAKRTGKWKAVWQRFADAPAKFPNLPPLLDQVASPGSDNWESFPAHDLAQEAVLRAGLLGVADLATHVARGEILDLEGLHGPRRQGVWAALGRSPLAAALEHLATLAETVKLPTGSNSLEDLKARYVDTGWKADLAVLRALAAVQSPADAAAVTAAIRAVYLPWLDGLATALQKHIASAPKLTDLTGSVVPVADGECVLFADGLRFDVGQLLMTALTDAKCSVGQTTAWSGLPTVTATCKSAASPIVGLLHGVASGTEFLPQVKATGKALTTAEFRGLLTASGVQYLANSEVGDPEGKAWTEHGALDKMGHEQDWKLAWRIDEEVAGLAQRVQALLAAGWTSVRVVTDHGWILVPGGLAKAQLHANMAETKWSRCAILKDGATSPYPTADWSWCPGVRVAVAPGASVFWAGKDYAHGGWSLQESLTPVLTVTRPGAKPAKITMSVKWKQLTCNVVVEGAQAGSTVDLRAKVAAASTSLLESPKLLVDGKARLLVADDSHEGAPAHLVVIDSAGNVRHKELTEVGGKS